MTNLKRLYLLPEAEIINLYARPDFNVDERELYFVLNPAEKEILAQYSNIRTRVFFILQLGYFKAKYQFFSFNFDDVRADVDYIVSHFFQKTTLILSGRISRQYISLQKQNILQLFEYHDWSEEKAPIIEAHLSELLKYYPKSHDALRQLWVYLDSQKIVIPSYRTLQDIFTLAFSTETKRLDKHILQIPLAQQKQLSDLIQCENGITKLNVIRADQKDFQYTAFKAELTKASELADLYEFSKQFIPTLDLSKNAIRYYSDLAERYAASRLRRLSQTQQWLQVICFIHHRYQQIMDNLVTSFMYHTKMIMDAGKAYADKALMEHNASLVKDFPKLAKFLKWFPNRSSKLSHEEINQAAYKILPKKQFSAMAQFLDESIFDKKAAEREFYLTVFRRISRSLRPVLLNVPFVFFKDDNEIMPLIKQLKDHYAKGKSPASFKLSDDLQLTISKKMLRYLKKNSTDEQIDPHLFEFFVYRKMYYHLAKGRLCCNESVSYCDMEHDLIDDALVDDVEKIALEFGYPNIPIYCDKRLDDAIMELDNTWVRTTKRIQSGENTGFNITETKAGEKDWTLNYDSSDKLDDAFFKTLPKVAIPDVMMYMGDLLSMWPSFSHMKSRYNKKKTPVKLALNAGILAEAFGISSEQMADMSDLSYNTLRSTQEDFIRVETLCDTNVIASNFINSLPIFKIWNLLDNKLLADADGQKLPTSKSTIQSRYSTKYLGKSPGISVYTLVANSVAVNARNMGLNEYEGHSLYDMIYGNKTDIEINMVTGDNHSINQVNYVILDGIDVQYVPSIKDVREAANKLYSVNFINDDDTAMIRAKGSINTTHIRSEKRGILRVLLSLLMQENTQSTLVRKLNTHAGYSSLKKALFDYNEILRSTHILNMIDNMNLRKAIRTARNRTEAYHQLQGSIRKIYRGVFKGKKITNNRISAHAVRLVANCIIAYNSIILNSIYEKMVKDGVNQKIINEFARISPIAWIHIAFTGQYSFKKSNGEIDIASMVNALESHLKKHFWKVA